MLVPPSVSDNMSSRDISRETLVPYRECPWDILEMMWFQSHMLGLSPVSTTRVDSPS